MIPHYGLCYKYPDGTLRAAAKILVLVLGLERSSVRDMGQGKVIETSVEDPGNKNVFSVIRTYSTEVRLLDFKIDRSLAAVMVTSKPDDRILEADQVCLLQKQDSTAIFAAWERLGIDNQGKCRDITFRYRLYYLSTTDSFVKNFKIFSGRNSTKDVDENCCSKCCFGNRQEATFVPNR